jgi:hypothetical protein
VDPVAVMAMAERGIDISGEFPKPWTDETVGAADVVITMGCGDACPVLPGKRYEDWLIDDPAGRDLTTVRRIRDHVERRVRMLVGELGLPLPRARPPGPAQSGPSSTRRPRRVRLGGPMGANRTRRRRTRRRRTPITSRSSSR